MKDKAGPSARGRVFDVKCASVIFGDLKGEGESEALGFFASGEEWFEGPLSDIRLHTRTLIEHGDAEVVTRLQRKRGFLAESEVLDVHFNNTVCERFIGILEQNFKGFREEVCVGDCGPEDISGSDVGLGAWAEHRLLAGLLNEGFSVDGCEFGLAEITLFGESLDEVSSTSAGLLARRDELNGRSGKGGFRFGKKR